MCSNPLGEFLVDSLICVLHGAQPNPHVRQRIRHVGTDSPSVGAGLFPIALQMPDQMRCSRLDLAQERGNIHDCSDLAQSSPLLDADNCLRVSSFMVAIDSARQYRECLGELQGTAAQSACTVYAFTITKCEAPCRPQCVGVCGLQRFADELVDDAQ